MFGDRGPAEERRRRAEEPADDDVLRRRALQPQRVDDAVAEPAGDVEPGRQRIDHEEGEERGADDAGHGGEGDAAAEAHAAGGHRPVLRARHVGVDACIGDVVHGRRRAGDEGDADEGDSSVPSGGTPGVARKAPTAAHSSMSMTTTRGLVIS